MFEDLSLKLETALKKVRGQGKLTEKNISDTLREIRRVLLDADVNYKVAKEFIEKVSVKALGEKVIASISPGQLITKIINDELTELLGGDIQELKINASGITTILSAAPDRMPMDYPGKSRIHGLRLHEREIRVARASANGNPMGKPELP